MLLRSINRIAHTFDLDSLLLSLCPAAPVFAAQTPSQTPTQTPTRTPANPAQQDATRPPGTEQRQSVPEQSRPVTQDPTAPPKTPVPESGAGVVAPGVTGVVGVV